jgi:hypothetical protein
MATIIITDLLQERELNREAMSQLRGGSSFASRLTPGEPIRVFIPNEPIRTFIPSDPIRGFTPIHPI